MGFKIFASILTELLMGTDDGFQDNKSVAMEQLEEGSEC